MRPVSNPPNPYASQSIEWLGEPPPAELIVYEEHAKSILSANTSPDLPFRFSVNPYRGCQHACSYCYARPTHQRLGFGAGTDFDRRIVVKVNTPELLSLELTREAVRGHTIAFSGVTDAYQPLEANYELTRRSLEVCLARGVSVAMITKAALIGRDAELLGRIHERAGALVNISIPFMDPSRARAIEPAASPPSKRIEAIARLSAAGVPVSVAFAPWIPGLNDDEIPRVLEAARNAGAERAWIMPLRLPQETRDVFFERLAASYPDRVNKVTSGLCELRDGGLNDANFHTRFDGSGPRWQAARSLFEITARRLGLRVERDFVDENPPGSIQGSLF